MTVRPVPGFADDVHPMTRDDYDSVVGRYAERCAPVPGVRAIYQFGAVSAPGLSDLDLIVVLDGAKVRDARDLQLLSIEHPHWRSDSMVARCFIHDVLLCDVEVFRSIGWLIVGSRPEIVAGAPVDIMEAPLPTRVHVMLAQALDFCLARLHEFARFRGRPGLSKRWLIPQLWSISHTRSLLRAIGIPLATSWDTLVAALEDLRANPTALRDEALGALWATVETHFGLAATLLLDELMRRGELTAGGGVRGCTVASAEPQAITVYDAREAGMSGSRVSVTMLTSGIRVGRRRVESGWTLLTTPVALLLHHLGYLRASPTHTEIAKRIAGRAHVGRHEALSPGYREVLRRRMTLVETNDNLLRRLGLSFGRIQIPALPRRPFTTSASGTMRYRALKALLDWRLLPNGTIAMPREDRVAAQ